MKSISDPAQRRQITKLMAVYVEAGAAIVRARARVAELHDRRTALQQRARDEAPSPPPVALGISDSFIANLVADPSAQLDEAEVAAAAAAHDRARSASKVQRTRLSAIDAAMVKLDEAIADAEQAVPAAEQVEKAARVQLLDTIHGALVREFKARWEALASEVIDPMMALGFDPDIRSPTRDHIGTDSFLRFWRWDYNPERGGTSVDEKLLLLDPHRLAEREAHAPAVVDRLLTEISSDGQEPEIQATFKRSRERIRAAWVAALDAAGRRPIDRSSTISF